MYQFQALDKISMEQIAACFNLAFSDYEQPIHFTAESLKYYLTASSVDLSLSFGAFCEEEMVGFILNSSGLYNDQDAVFDAGTGVVPEHRGKKVFSDLFDYTAQQLQYRGIGRYYLEVLQSNHHAVSIYSKKGFSVLREYAVLVGSGTGDDCNNRVGIMPYQDFCAFETNLCVEPSFEHSSYNINRNPQLYEVRYLDNLAYCIYAKRNGEIIQMRYNELDALKKVMAALTKQYPRAMAKNVDFRYCDVLQMLEEVGFKEITRQYEMVRDI